MLGGRVLLGCLLGVLMAAPGALVAGEATAADPLFADDSVLSIRIAGPFRSMSRDRSAEPEYSAGRVSWIDADGAEQVQEIQLRPRGKSRRDRQVCRFPPLRLNFQKNAVEGTIFENQNVLKLVTHCENSAAFQRYVLKEYLAYRIFNLLSDVSFRVRLLNVTYEETESNRKDIERVGFLIEHKRRLGARFGTEEAEVKRIQPKVLEPEQASIAELFQFLVSNTDYSFIAGPPDDEKCCHNAVLLLGPDDTLIPVPYDLDRTGFVDPPNGLPDENLGQKSFRDRLFRGFCRDPAYLDAAIAKANAQRETILALVRNQEGLTGGDVKTAERFIESFYRIINDAKSRERNLKCRSMG